MTSASVTIFIDNITNGDAKNRNIRITVDNKHLFPVEQLGNPITYHLVFKVNGEEFDAKYRIGSQDGKSRSGVLKIGDKAYNEILKIRVSTNLKITKGSDNKYLIERL